MGFTVDSVTSPPPGPSTSLTDVSETFRVPSSRETQKTRSGDGHRYVGEGRGPSSACRVPTSHPVLATRDVLWQNLTPRRTVFDRVKDPEQNGEVRSLCASIPAVTCLFSWPNVSSCGDNESGVKPTQVWFVGSSFLVRPNCPLSVSRFCRLPSL